MYRIVFVAAIISAPAFAQEADATPICVKPENLTPVKQKTHDIKVGYCAAYHMFQGQGTAARKIQLCSFDRMQMAQSGSSLAQRFQISEESKKSALELGKKACEALAK